MTFEENIEICLKSGFPLISIDTQETLRATASIKEIINKWNKKLPNKQKIDKEALKITGYGVYEWDINKGWFESSANGDTSIAKPEFKNPTRALKYTYSSDAREGIYILHNFHLQLDNPSAYPILTQDFIDLSAVGFLRYKHIVIMGAFSKGMGADIRPLFKAIDFNLPTKEEIIDMCTKYDELVKTKINPERAEEIAQASLGMTLYEAEKALAASIVSTKGERVDLDIIFEEKARAVKRTGLLEFVQSEGGMDDVGGLNDLKEWCKKRSARFKQAKKAEDYKLPIPKGFIVTGVAGTGKTLIAKAVAKEFSLPLFRCDVGKVFGSLVGETERNARELFNLIDAVSPAVILFDEFEKAMSGLDSSNYTDSGVTSRFIGNFLYHLQEKKSLSFYVATSNDAEKIPTPLLRKGRFDEIWFVDVPTIQERKEIFQIHLRKTGRDVSKFDIGLLSKEAEGLVGSEIEGVIGEAMYIAFSKDRDYTTEDIVEAIKNTPQLIKTKAEDINAIKKWAEGRARRANAEFRDMETMWNITKKSKKAKLILD